MELTAKQILDMKVPGELFKSETDIKNEYTRLAKIWHPDSNKSPDANNVMAKINELYNKGIELIDSGKWIIPGLLKLTTKDGKSPKLSYRISHDFELGTMYIANNVVLYLLESSYKDMYNNAKKVINGFTFPSEKMKSEMKKYLPSVVDSFETTDDKLGIVMQKTPDLLLLKDVLAYYDGKLPARHAAWILSSLYNISCYIDFSKLSHNAISLDTYFISPQFHGGALLGGWWYSVEQDKRMLGVPAGIYSVMPPHIKNDKVGSIQTDLESIRLIGRSILGDKNGTRLTDVSDAPKPLIDWVRVVSASTAVNDYTKWQDVLTESFGERKFVVMDLDADKLYSKIKN